MDQVKFPLKNLTGYGMRKADPSTNFTWSALEYFVLNKVCRRQGVI